MDAGDEIICSTKLGYLVVMKPTGTVIDLNDRLMDTGCTTACIDATKQLNPFTFLQLAGILAASYGLGGSSVAFGPGGFVVPVYVPGAEVDFGSVPSERANAFMRNPQVPSLSRTDD